MINPLSHRTPLYPNLEACIRAALDAHQLMPGTERYIESVIRQKPLSQRDRDLLRLLNDAIQDGCIARVNSTLMRP